jgi:ParB family chromosome partitioning protein
LETVTNISTEVLKRHPRNTEFFDDIEGEAYEQFKKCIQEEGIITPLIVAPDMTLISGHQRLKAAIDLNIKSVPIIIRESIESEDEKTKKLLASNFGRLKNSPVKQSKIITEYEKLCGITHGGDRKSKPQNAVLKQEDIAKQLGISVDTLQRIKKLQDLIPEFQHLIDEKDLSIGIASRILSRLTKEEQKDLFKYYLNNEQLKKLTKEELQKYVDTSIDDMIKEKTKTFENIASQQKTKAKQTKAEYESLRKDYNKLITENNSSPTPKDYKALQDRIKELEKQVKQQDNETIKELGKSANKLQGRDEVSREQTRAAIKDLYDQSKHPPVPLYEEYDFIKTDLDRFTYVLKSFSRFDRERDGENKNMFLELLEPLRDQLNEIIQNIQGEDKPKSLILTEQMLKEQGQSKADPPIITVMKNAAKNRELVMAEEKALAELQQETNNTPTTPKPEPVEAELDGLEEALINKPQKQKLHSPKYMGNLEEIKRHYAPQDDNDRYLFKEFGIRRCDDDEYYDQDGNLTTPF